jgi:D-3-phosphoglycerate dehydrogenase
MPDVLITENITGSPIEALKRAYQVSFQPDLWKDPAALLAAASGVRALIVRNQTRVTAEVVEAAGRLEIIARAGVGLDNVDVQAASRRGVVVAYTPSQNALSVAELTVGLMLALVRKIPAADRHVKQSLWARHQFMGSELHGKTLGVVGFGRIGSLTASRAAAFGMKVLAYDPYVARSSGSEVSNPKQTPSLKSETPNLESQPASRQSPIPNPQSLPSCAPSPAQPLAPCFVSLDELLGAADVVSCHLPSTEETQSMFDYSRFCRMQTGAVFVNVARGEVVDEDGLVRALREGKIAGAALDVRRKEPPGPGPLGEMDNVVLTPHIGAFTHEGQQRVVEAVCRDVAAVLGGGEAVDFANFPRPRRARG